MLSMLAALAVVVSASVASALSPPTTVRVEYISDSKWTTIDTPLPRFSWVPMLDAGTTQQGYQIQVFDSKNPSTPLYDSGHVTSADAINIVYAGSPIAADTDASVQVRVWDSSGAQSDWSDSLPFVVGPRAPGDWRGAAWIGCDQSGEMSPTNPVPARNRLRAEASLPTTGATVTRARLYVAGTGYVRAFVNDKLAGPKGARLQAGWTGFRQRVLYTTADVTTMVAKEADTAAGGTGSVVLGIELGNGWADVLPAAWNGTVSKGAVPWKRGGAQRKALAQLIVDFSDGSSSVLITNTSGAPAVQFRADAAAPLLGAPSNARTLTTASPAAILPAAWQCGAGPRVNDSVYDGESFDARRQTPGWSAPGWVPTGPVAASWGKAIAALPFSAGIVLSAQSMPAVAEQTTFNGVINRTADPGPNQTQWVFDFGQNMAGATRVSLGSTVPSGVKFTIQHAEALMHPPYGPVDGTVYVGNLRSALQTDTYIHDGVSDFHDFGQATYHGFRFAQVTVTGAPSGWVPNTDTVVAVHFRSDVQRLGSFSAGDADGLYDKIHHAAAWVEADNLMSVPSDCDQRDERKGWMGDSALSTESFYLNFDMPAFMSQWSQNMRDQQINPYQPAHGHSVGDTTPLTFGSAPGDPSWQTAYPSAVHWQWRVAGDNRLASGYFDALVLYLSDLTAAAAGGLDKLFAHYGEWVTPPDVLPTDPNQPTQGPKPPKSLISSFNYILDIGRLAALATGLGNNTLAQHFTALEASTKKDFVAAFWDPSINAFGAGKGDTDGLQVSNTLALTLNAVDNNDPAPPMASLVNDILVSHNGHHAVGITGSKFMWRKLVDMGRADMAVNLTLQTEYPSFGFMIKGGNNGYEPATTLWELWTAPVSGPGMNSRAHHMFSSIDLFFYNYIAGIDMCADAFTYSCVQYMPRVTAQPRVPWANATIPTMRGPASIAWSNGTSLAAAKEAGDDRAAMALPAAVGTFALQANLPTGGSTGNVVLPVSSASATVTVGGVTVWDKGTFVPGAKLVTNGVASPTGISFTVGPGGSFAFTATGDAVTSSE